MYVPKLNDYVLWDHPHFPIQGWVYFVDSEYITIEIGVKPVICTKGTSHRMNHTLVVCYNQQWNELKYLTKREPNLNVETMG